MKMKKTIGIIAVAVLGLMAITWTADAATDRGCAQVVNGTACNYYANDKGSCGHWYRWLPGHRNRCVWNNCNR
jgi:hypothetical protein